MINFDPNSRKTCPWLKQAVLRIFLACFVCLWLTASAAASPSNTLTTPGMTREFNNSLEEVREAVLAIQKDRIIHGTLIFDKEPTLTGAETAASTPLFEPWTGSGEVYYKIRKNAIAPRHFLESADQGTIAVRYVITSVNSERIRVRIDAVYLEAAHKIYHASDGSVEKSEMKEVKEALEAMQQAAMDAADTSRREHSAELVRQSYVRQREDESTRLANAQSSAKELEEEIAALRHEVERRVKAPGAVMKAAPFQSAATLKPLLASTEVVVLILTPHWLGVETPEGLRGWLRVEDLEPLP